MNNWHTLEQKKVLELLESNADYGLADKAIARRQQDCGKNEPE